MPRCWTVKPVAFATIACSNEIFEPSANDVTIAGFWPHCLGEPLLRRRVAVGVLQALDVADHARLEAEALHPAVEVELDARLVAVAGRHDHAVPVGVDVEDRADRRLELGVHQHDVLAVRERLERDLRAELDRAGHLADHVDVLAPAEEERIVGHGRAAGARRRPRTRPASRPRPARGPRSGRPRPPARAAGWRSPTTRIPGTLLTIWFVRPWPMKPAPTMPTRIGRPSASRAFSAVSTMITPRPPFAGAARARSRRAAPSARPSPRSTATGSGQLEAEPRIVAARGRPRRRACRTRRRSSSSPCRRPASGSRARTARARRASGRSPRRAATATCCEVGRALGPQVDDDVDDRAARAADDLRLGRRRKLEVHPAQRAGDVG